MFFQCRQTNQRNVGITSFFLINFLWELRGARLRSPETIILNLTCFQCSYTRIKIKSFQIVWIFPKIKRHNSLNFTCFHCKVHPHIFNFESSQIFFGNRRIARVFKVRYARTFLRIKLSNGLNFMCCHCKVHPHNFNFDMFLFVGNLCKNWILQICLKSLPELDMVGKINNGSAFCHNKSPNCELNPVQKRSLVTKGLSSLPKLACHRSNSF